MRLSRTTLTTGIILFSIIGISLGYLFYSPTDDQFEANYRKLKSAALRGDPTSQMSLGIFHIYTEDGTKEGLMWIQKSCDQGHPAAQLFMGESYCEGEFTEKDEARGIELYRKAAIQGFYPAQSRLADCYAMGLGLEKNPPEALKWYHLAASKGDSLAMNNIGSMHLHGIGLKQNTTEAYKWFLKAAQSGNAGSQLTTGQLLADGDGCEKDEVEAYAWLKISAEEEPNAVKDLRELRNKISAEQISAAMARVQILKAEISRVVQKHEDETAVYH